MLVHTILFWCFTDNTDSNGELRITFGEDQGIEFDDIDIGVADNAIAFEVSGRILGLDETTLGRVAGKRLVPTELRLDRQDTSSPD